MKSDMVESYNIIVGSVYIVLWIKHLKNTLTFFEIENIAIRLQY